MQSQLFGAFALAGACALLYAATAHAEQSAPPQECEVHVYPADGLHSVGEDFDAVKRVDQDLKHYYAMAGRSLDWLTPARQLKIIGQMPIGTIVGITEKSRAMHADPLTRREALAPEPRASASGCLVELRLPQIMLERGGLAERSLRVFGVVHRYENGQQVSTFSSYGAAPMPGFRLRSPAEAEAATQVVERAYRGAVEELLANSAKPRRK